MDLNSTFTKILTLFLSIDSTTLKILFKPKDRIFKKLMRQSFDNSLAKLTKMDYLKNTLSTFSDLTGLIK
jgi:hypothetical protein